MALAALASALLASATAQAGVVRRALIVAYNGSDRPGTAPLRFADDDGYRWREALERLGFEATLLTVPDADTAALEAQRGTPPLVPTAAALDRAVAGLAERARVDRASGASVDVLVVYVGHGQTDELGRFDGAWLGWGVSLGAPAMLAPLGAVGVSGGVSAAFRSDGWLYWGARAQWTLALGTLGGAALHRSTLGPLVGLRGKSPVAPSSSCHRSGRPRWWCGQP